MVSTPSCRSVLVVALLAGVLHCQEESPSSATTPTQTATPTHLDINGTWVIRNIDIGTGVAPGSGEIVCAVTDSSYTARYLPSNAIASGTIVKFSNESHTMMLYITRDDLYPDQLPYYEKASWQQPSATTLILAAYRTAQSLTDAESTSAVIWGPTPEWQKQ